MSLQYLLDFLLVLASLGIHLDPARIESERGRERKLLILYKHTAITLMLRHTNNPLSPVSPFSPLSPGAPWKVECEKYFLTHDAIATSVSVSCMARNSPIRAATVTVYEPGHFRTTVWTQTHLSGIVDLDLWQTAAMALFNATYLSCHVKHIWKAWSYYSSSIQSTLVPIVMATVYPPHYCSLVLRPNSQEERVWWPVLGAQFRTWKQPCNEFLKHDSKRIQVWVNHLLQNYHHMWDNHTASVWHKWL